MKKSDILSLVLITSALASCHTSNTLYTTRFSDNNYPSTDTIPPHWVTAFSVDSSRQQIDSLYYPNMPNLDFQLPTNFYVAPKYYYSPDIHRGGFGHHGSYHSISS